MNTLTKNRILEKGDQYRDNGTWKPVPENDIGLQIMFTKYAEVRRPSEQPLIKVAPDEKLAEGFNGRLQIATKPILTNAEWDKALAEAITPIIQEPISPDREMDKTAAPAKAEGETSTPVPIHSGAGGIPLTETEKAIAKAKVEGRCSDLLKLTFPEHKGEDDSPIWTGRNGTFTGYGLELMQIGERVMLSPIGKRGVGNCTIQFPTSIIPELVDWLLRQQTMKETPK